MNFRSIRNVLIGALSVSALIGAWPIIRAKCPALSGSNVSAPVSSTAPAIRAPQTLRDENAPPSQLPPLPPVAGEDKLQEGVSVWIKATAQPLNASAELEAVAVALKPAAEILQDRETAERLYMYKYALRYFVERVQALQAAGAIPSEVAFFTDERGQWKPLNQEWRFEPFEEAVYAALYGSGALEPNGTSGSQNTIVPFTGAPCPRWSTQVVCAIRSRDLELMRSLHNQAELGEAPQWPVEVFRQLFTYATTRRGEEQWKKISHVFAGHPLKDQCWAEVGYGAGVIFPVLRRELGEKATIYGTEIDKGCELLVDRMEKTGKAAWGHIELRPSSLNDCLLPENSVDFIHPGLVHIADGPEELLERDWLPLMASMKKALKPGGLLIVDNGGTPSITKVRRLMELAGFEEVAYHEEPGEFVNGEPIYYVSYRVKKP